MVIDPSQYTGKEPMHLQVLGLQWRKGQFWRNNEFLNFVVGAAVFALAAHLTVNEDAKDEDRSGAKEWVLTAFEMLDLYKDTMFLLYFPHANLFTTAGLSLSMCAPLTILWVRHRDIRRAAKYFLGVQNLFPVPVDAPEIRKVRAALNAKHGAVAYLEAFRTDHRRELSASIED